MQHPDEVITTRQRLRALGCRSGAGAALRFSDHIDGAYRRFIVLSPFVLVGTSGSDGLLDVSPRGGPPGFVKVIDEKTLAIPERPGNNRLDTLENVLGCEAVGLCFLVPGRGETLRVSGAGSVVRDRRLRLASSADAPDATLHLLVEVGQAFLHCPKSMAWSKLWSPAEWPPADSPPTMAEAKRAHGTERPV